MEDSYRHDVSAVIALLKTSEKTGLTEKEAERRLELYGRNEIPAQPPSSFFKLLLKQFEDLLVLILLGAAAVSFLLALVEDAEDRLAAFMEPTVILIILIANAAVGVVQETNAEAAISALKEMEALEAFVLRDGKVRSIDPALLVAGDIVQLSNGDKVPADVRLTTLTTACITTDEASLTGEPVPVMKHTDVIDLENAVDQDKRNICFRSTLVTRGKGFGVVVLTGSQTSIGKIQEGLHEDEDAQKTPLQNKLDEFGELLSKVILFICIAVWLINIGHFTEPEHGGFFKGAIYYFKIAVALAVAAIPEGLPAVVTTCLALGTMKMAKKNAIVRSLPSVETLGCTTVICSDKTGTLTTNKMTVTKVMTMRTQKEVSVFDVTGDGWNPKGTLSSSDGSKVEFPAGETALNMIGMISTLCNDSTLVYTEEDSVPYSKIGESTEAALKVLAEKISVPEKSVHKKIVNSTDPKKNVQATHDYWSKKAKKSHSLEFDRKRKSMSVVVTQGEETMLLVKGSPESVIARCTQMQVGNKIATMPNSVKTVAFAKIEAQFASRGLRCLALAYRKNPDYPEEYYRDFKHYPEVESELVFVGVVGMLDPPREEVSRAIEVCRDAQIRIIVITGDNKTTAVAIGRMIGVFDQNEDVSDKAFTGAEFFALSPEKQAQAIKYATLFARVEPMHKKRLVDLLQSQGEVVAMTGDGVNDAPALKAADIGVAMGSGTAVAKEASDMVLQDDNFSTIVMAVEEGRAIYANTKQFIRYLISSNIGEVACIFFTAAIGMPEALIPVQLLWVNLVTDGLPATALGFNKPDADIMTQPPRGRSEKIINGWMFFRYLFIGLYIGVATCGGFIWWYLYYANGPMVTFEQLTNFHGCEFNPELFNGVDCAVFSDPRPSTVSLSILVMIEMLNTFNALSENQSLFSLPPWSNIWVVLAVILSTGFHLLICYWPTMANIFSVAPIGQEEWLAVMYWSLPVLVLDEVLKLVTRLTAHRRTPVEHKKIE